ncbi:MAG: glycerophosphodiester phosphodiesterase [Candidatus Lokiarchaeota archaeon]|nr:glycerophosphodiester phosphodiesterase [Candidatus Lokiarchaeota archaeon]
MLIIAHRGASSIAPENTLKAFQKAIDLKADYIEFDVHKTKDDEIVIMHDGNTFRTTGHFGLIKNMDLEELKQLDCGEGETIPTLHELINLTKGKIRLNCEIKARNIAEKIIKTIKEADIIDTTIISSFKHDVLLKIQKLEPRIKLASLEPTRTGWIKSWLSRKKLHNEAINNRFYAINPFYKLVNRQFIIKAHKNNIRIFPWTVNTDNSIKKLVEISVDGIITNDISRVRKILNNLY